MGWDGMDLVNKLKGLKRVFQVSGTTLQPPAKIYGAGQA
jgi:hypothetical protein